MFPSNYQHHAALDREFMSKYLRSVADECRKRKFDTLVGCGLSSIPWAVRLSTHFRKPYVLVRKRHEPVQANFAHPVVGRFGPKRRCLMVDDTVWRGTTRDWVAEQLLEHEATLVDIVRLDQIYVDGLALVANSWSSPSHVYTHQKEVGNEPTT